MNKFVFIIFSTFLFFQFLSCKSTQNVVSSAQVENFRIGFYNVENLFDTIDIADKIDEEFTPSSKKKWNTKRYFKKLNDLARIVEAIQYPAILGLCEVENKTVLNDFSKETSLKNHNYEIVHYESPDQRGIDVALMYQKNFMVVLDSKPIRIDFPKAISGEENYTSRDILYVKGQLENKEVIHLFVNHFPSRRGGVKASEPKRIHVAKYLKKEIETIQEKDKNAKILLMGDFNDETDNNSIANTIGAKKASMQVGSKDLINCSAKLDEEGKGTYNFRGNWNMLDQIIVSGAFMNAKSKIIVGDLGIFQEEWMMFKSDRNGWTPNRTYGGPNYYGGFSDHLPIYVEIKMSN